MCTQAANHCALFWAWEWTHVYNLGAWSGSKPFDTLIAFLKVFFAKVNLSDNDKSMKNYPSRKELMKAESFLIQWGQKQALYLKFVNLN